MLNIKILLKYTAPNLVLAKMYINIFPRICEVGIAVSISSKQDVISLAYVQ